MPPARGRWSPALPLLAGLGSDVRSIVAPNLALLTGRDAPDPVSSSSAPRACRRARSALQPAALIARPEVVRWAR